MNMKLIEQFPQKKTHPTSARLSTPSRIPLPNNPRKLSNDDIPVVCTNDGPFSRPPLQGPTGRSKSLHNSILYPSASPLNNSSDEASFLSII